MPSFDRQNWEFDTVHSRPDIILCSAAKFMTGNINERYTTTARYTKLCNNAELFISVQGLGNVQLFRYIFNHFSPAHFSIYFFDAFSPNRQI